MGWIREVVVEADGAVRRAGVLGIMSDSPEETAEEARTALSNDPNAEKLIAIDGSHSGGREGRTRSRVIRFRAPRGECPISREVRFDRAPSHGRRFNGLRRRRRLRRFFTP
jgi:hypothetical protein